MNKFFLSFLSFVLLFTLLQPGNQVHAETTTSYSPELEESTELKAAAEKYEAIIMELDVNLNMYDLDSNTSSEIASLSPAAQEFYELYKTSQLEKTKKLVTDKNDTLKSSTVTAAALPNIGGVKKYYFSNQQVRDITSLVALHGTGWGFAIAIAKKFAKSPSYITLLVIAVPALGAAVLNRCNRYGKGVVIQDVRVGATHSFTCFSR